MKMQTCLWCVNACQTYVYSLVLQVYPLLDVWMQDACRVREIALTFASDRYPPQLQRPSPPKSWSVIYPEIVCITHAAHHVTVSTMQHIHRCIQRSKYLVTNPLTHLRSARILGVTQSLFGIRFNSRVYMYTLDNVAADPTASVARASKGVGRAETLDLSCSAST